MKTYHYTLKNGAGRWGADANYKDKQQKKQGFRTRAEAEAWCSDTTRKFIEADKQGRLYAPVVTLDQLVDRWRIHKGKRVKASTMIDYEKQLKRILPAFNNRPLDTITPMELQDFLDSLRTPRITNKTRVVLSSLFKAALGWGLVGVDPTRPLTGLKEEKKEVHFLTHEEAARLLDNLDGQYHLLAFLGLTTGMRVGEISALRYQDVKKDHIIVNRSYGRGAFGTPKTKGSTRKVAISPSVYQTVMLFRHQVDENPSPDKLIFTCRGKPLENWNVRDKLATASKHAGIETVRPHDLRHTYAAWCLSAGVHVKFVQQQLGHSTIAITMDLYGHMLDSVKEGFRDWLEKEIGNISEGVIQDSDDGIEQDVGGKVIKLAGRTPYK